MKSWRKTHGDEEDQDGQEAETGEHVGYHCWWALLWFTKHMLQCYMSYVRGKFTLKCAIQSFTLGPAYNE